MFRLLGLTGTGKSNVSLAFTLCSRPEHFV
jgi:hypothetical protein